MRRIGLVLCSFMLLSACISDRPAPVVSAGKRTRVEDRAVDPRPDAYVVKRYDTLYSIALENGVDWHDLAAWNQIGDPTRLSIGQTLRVKPPQPMQAANIGNFDGPVQVQPIAAVGSIESKPIQGDVPAVPMQGKPQALRTATASSSTASNASANPTPSANASTGSASNSVSASVRNDSQPVVATIAKPEAAKTVEAPAAKADSGEPEAPGEIDWDWPAQGKLLNKFAENGSKGVQIAGRAGDVVVASAPGKVTYVGDGIRGYGNLVIVKHNDKYLSVYAHAKRALVQGGQTVTRGQKIAEMGGMDASSTMLHFEIRRFGKPVDPLLLLPSRD